MRTWAGPCWAGVVGRYHPSPNGTASGAAGMPGTCCFVLYRCPVLTSACNPSSLHISLDLWAASRSPGGSVCTFWFCQTCGFGCRVRNRCPYSSCTLCMRGPWRLLLRWLPWDCQLTPASLLLPCFLWGGPWVAAEELGLPLCVCVGDWLIQSSLRSVWGSIVGDSLGMRLDVLLASPSCGRLVVGCLLLRPFPLGGLIAPPSFP